MRRSHAQLLGRLRTVELERIAISAVTEAELLFGVKLSGRPKLAREAYEGFIEHVRVLEWGRHAAEHYADIRAYLLKRGEMIGGNDLMIAAHGRSIGATLVTNNEREFRRVKGLIVENWAS
jgi:tRNA(fMet)-specific endonuclease VapC